MSDLFLNENFEVEIDSSGDLKTVSGEARVEQSVAIHVTNAMQGVIGEVRNYEKKVEMAVTRALREHSLLEDTENVQIERAEEAGFYRVAIDYRTSSFSFEVEGDT